MVTVQDHPNVFEESVLVAEGDAVQARLEGKIDMLSQNLADMRADIAERMGQMRATEALLTQRAGENMRRIDGLEADLKQHCRDADVKFDQWRHELATLDDVGRVDEKLDALVMRQRWIIGILVTIIVPLVLLVVSRIHGG